jgi:HKD family nuclease
MTLAFGGTAQPKHIFKLIRDNIAGFDRLAIAVSYVQVSGWELLRPLIGAKANQVRLLCTDQFGITDPAAIRALQKAGVQVHAYDGKGVYHPKIYIASFANKSDRWVLGSPNLSRSALESGVEAAFTADDAQGQALAWFDDLFANKSHVFDAAKLQELEAAFAARIKGNLATARARPVAAAAVHRDPVAAEAIEAAFGALPNVVVPLNADKAGNNVRTLRRIKEVLDDPTQLKGKAFSEFKLIGLARDGGYTPTGIQAQGKSLAEIANIWMRWLKHATPVEIQAANPSGRLAQGAIAFETFWSFPQDVRDFFLANSTKPNNQTRPSLQVIELLANTGRRMPTLTMADVSTLSKLLGATEQLSPRIRTIIRDYLDNKGTRGWREPDRELILEAWRAA